MNAIIRAAADLQALCEAQQWRYYVRRQLTPLTELEESPEILTTLDEKRREFDP